jgi:hypothetical protein
MKKTKKKKQMKLKQQTAIQIDYIIKKYNLKQESRDTLHRLGANYLWYRKLFFITVIIFPLTVILAVLLKNVL